MDAPHWSAAPGERLTDADWRPRFDEPEPEICVTCGARATEWFFWWGELVPYCLRHYEERMQLMRSA